MYVRRLIKKQTFIYLFMVTNIVISILAVECVGMSVQNAVGLVCFEQELEKNWPREFGRDLTSTNSFGKLSAKKIYHVRISSYRNDTSVKVARFVVKFTYLKVH